MNRKEACKILGVSGNYDSSQLKKRYRQLLHLVHPDGAAFRQEDEEYPYGIHEIQTAYAVLSGNHLSAGDSADSKGGTDNSASVFDEEDSIDDNPDAWMRRDPEYAKAVWDASENADAFCEREILQYIEDYDGSVLGVFTLARGKFLWKPEEEFPLFLQSISRVTAKMIAQIEEKIERQIWGSGKEQCNYELYDAFESRRDILKPILKQKLTYLLAQQFIDAANTLDQLVKTKKSEDGSETVYYIPAMLEKTSRPVGKYDYRVGMSRGYFAKAPEITMLSSGETLYPEKIENHRLYLKNVHGESLGYLSFPDDRMYYLVVPLFEQRRVQVKIRVAQQLNPKRSHVSLNLWLKFKKTTGGVPEDINSQIQALLDGYREDLLK